MKLATVAGIFVLSMLIVQSDGVVCTFLTTKCEDKDHDLFVTTIADGNSFDLMTVSVEIDLFNWTFVLNTSLNKAPPRFFPTSHSENSAFSILSLLEINSEAAHKLSWKIILPH